MKIVFILILSVLSSISFAKDCDETQSELNVCSKLGGNYADTELNTLYKKQMSYLTSPEDKTKLKKSQLAWIKFRDATCYYEVTSEGGSMYSM